MTTLLPPPLEGIEASIRDAIQQSRTAATEFSAQLLEARADLEKSQNLQMQLVVRGLGAGRLMHEKTSRDGGDDNDTASNMARARAEVEEEMAAQHEVLVEGVRQRLRAVRERALADATNHVSLP